METLSKINRKNLSLFDFLQFLSYINNEMKRAVLYISVVVILTGLSFAGPKDKGDSLSLSGHSAISLGEGILIGEAEDNIVQRKRSHKRRRQIRPRRNGF